jgi:hypothetical protein
VIESTTDQTKEKKKAGKKKEQSLPPLEQNIFHLLTIHGACPNINTGIGIGTKLCS